MDIGLIFDNIVGLAGVFLEMVVFAVKVLLGHAITLVIVLPIFLALRIHRRRQERTVAAQSVQRGRTKASTAGENRPHRGTKPRHAPPAAPPDGPVMGGGALRAGPGGFLDDPEAWILRQYPAKGALVVKTLALLGMIVAGLGAGLMGLLRLWAAAAPDFRDEEGSVLGTDEILEPNNMLDSPYPGAGKPLVSKYLRPPRDGYWLNR